MNRRCNFRKIVLTVFVFAAIGYSSLNAQETKKLPNILFILADDLGYGDLTCYNPDSRIPTPNLDQLALEGMRFTDAHSPSTVCTPTRYSILTGQMAFRTGMKGVFTGVAENTLVMFASDNGPEVSTVLNMRKTHKHDGARPWRGVKRDQWEGGHRTPFIVRWSGKVKANTTSDQLMSLTDVMATCADIVGVKLPDNAAEDSYSMLTVLSGTQGNKPVRQYMLQQTISLEMSIRDGNWKYLDHKGSGGNDYDGEGEWSMSPYKLEDTDPDAPGQLYNLETDPGETINLYSKYPGIVKKLKAKLEEFKNSGRSVPLRQYNGQWKIPLKYVNAQIRKRD